MARILMEDFGHTLIMHVQGNLSIQDSSALREHLLEAVSAHKGVVVDLTEAGTIDVACMQVLCSAHKTFKKAGKDIGISGEIPAGFIDSLKSMALAPETCDREPHGTCLFPSGGSHA